MYLQYHDIPLLAVQCTHPHRVFVTVGCVPHVHDTATAGLCFRPPAVGMVPPSHKLHVGSGRALSVRSLCARGGRLTSHLCVPYTGATVIQLALFLLALTHVEVLHCRTATGRT